MIRLTEPQRPRSENIVPMVNVAFLLLIFFLMTAVIAPQDPVSIDPPKGLGQGDVVGNVMIFIESDGALWKDGREVVAFGPLSGQNVHLRVAENLPGRVLARIFQDAKQAGAATISLVVARP